ncbi:MAG: HAD family phosphatase [Corynebacteriales bacterium]|nr:HAD family phosphatase [Mycobacteriales bacterium]
MSSASAIVPDLDRSVIPHGGAREMGARTREQLARHREEDVLVIPATGRERRIFDGIKRAFTNVGFDAAILSNGAEIVDSEGNLLRQLTISPDQLKTSIEQLDADGQVAFAVERDGTRLCGPGFPASQNPSIRQASLVELYSEPATKMIAFHSDAEEARLDHSGKPHARVNSIVAQVVARTSLIAAFAGMRGRVDIGPAGATKAMALAWLAEYLGIDIQNSVAFGDSPTDDDMLRLVGLGIAMGDASASTKQAADLIIGNADQDAVGQALEHIDFRKGVRANLGARRGINSTFGNTPLNKSDGGRFSVGNRKPTETAFLQRLFKQYKERVPPVDSALNSLEESIGVIWDYHAPFLVETAIDMLKDMKAAVEEDPSTKVVFVGRDGTILGAIIQVLDEKFYKDHCENIVMPRKEAEKMLQDYEKINKTYHKLGQFRYQAGEVDPADVPGAFIRTTDYLAQNGFPAPDEPGSLILVDTSCKATVPVLLSQVYRHVKMQTFLIVFRESPDDPKPETRRGYALHHRLNQPATGKMVEGLSPEDARYASSPGPVATLEHPITGPLGQVSGIRNGVPIQHPVGELDPKIRVSDVSPGYRHPEALLTIKVSNLATIVSYAQRIKDKMDHGEPYQEELAAGSRRMMDAMMSWAKDQPTPQPFSSMVQAFVPTSKKLAQLSPTAAELVARQQTMVTKPVKFPRLGGQP